MARDLLDRYDLVGLSKTKVLELLGEPDNTFPNRFAYQLGYMGTNGANPMAMPYRLVVTFYDEHTVREARIEE